MFTKDDPKETIPEDTKEQKIFKFLATIANAPWLNTIPSDHTDRLKRSFILFLHIVPCLRGPKPGTDCQYAAAMDDIAHLLPAFESASVEPDSDITRVRHAVALLIRTITRDIASIPLSSSLRSEHTQIFGLVDALEHLSGVQLGGVVQGEKPSTGEVVASGTWHEFWTTAQPIVVALAVELYEGGFSIDEERWREEIAEEERMAEISAGGI